VIEAALLGGLIAAGAVAAPAAAAVVIYRVLTLCAQKIAQGRSIAAISAEGREAILTRLTPTSDAAAVADADLVIEAVFEDLRVKTALWRELDGLASPTAIFATNTSSIAIRRLAEAVSGDRRQRFVGMHFFSPVPVMPLVELIRSSDTTDETVDAIRTLATDLGKKVIESADRPGFIVNRILIPFLAEAMHAFEQGVGTPEDIDTGARIGLNHPMGPLELSDFIGLDVVLGIMRVLEDGLGLDHMRPPQVLVDLVDAGHLGQKTGQGFYTYPRDKG